MIRAIEFAIANKDHFKIDIINLSLGHPIFEPAATDPLVRAVEKASKAGIIVVVSAGNHGVDEDGELGFGGTTSPGNAPSALTVGAADHNATSLVTTISVAVYSSSGPTWYDGLVKPDFVAPGHFLASEAAPQQLAVQDVSAAAQAGQSGKEFMQLSGTSMVDRRRHRRRGVAQAGNNYRRLHADAEPGEGRPAVHRHPAEGRGGNVYNPLRQGTGGVNA